MLTSTSFGNRTVILWLWGARDHVVVLRQSASPAEPGEPVEIAYHYDEAALRRRFGGQVPPDQWRWTCTPAQARRLWPMRRYRPWPACPECGAAIHSVSYADSARTMLNVLPCGQGLRIAEEPNET